MKIAINASFLRKQNTGIGQVSANFLKKLAQIETKKLQAGTSENEYVLYLEEDMDLQFPQNFEKRFFLPCWKRDDLIRKIWWEKFLLPKKIKQDDCEILFSLYQCPTIIKDKKIKHLMLVHDIIPKLFPQYLNNGRKKLYQMLSEKAMMSADKILVVSKRTEKDLIQHMDMDSKKITVSHIDVDEIYKKKVSELESKKILSKYKLTNGYVYCGGGLEVRKNVESVLRAYKFLRDQYGLVEWLPKLVISGKLMPQLAPLVTDAEALAEQFNIQDDVVLLDYVPQQDLPALYANARVFVYPSLYEGFGLPILEAMSQGIPVVTAKTSSLPEVGSDAVLYCNPHEVEDLAMVLKNVLVNESLRTSLREKSKIRANKFSWQKFAEKFLNIVSEMQ